MSHATVSCPCHTYKQPLMDTIADLYQVNHLYDRSYILFFCLQLMVCILLMTLVSNNVAVAKQEIEDMCYEVCNLEFYVCVRYDHCDHPKLRRRKWPLGVPKDCTDRRSKCLNDCLAACKLLRYRNLF